MIVYEKSKPSDAAEILDLANYVFSQAHCPHDFRTMVPKMFDTDEDMSDRHYVARVDGKIRALVDLWPLPIRFGGEELFLGLIGNVCVHPYDRGKQYMRHLMHMAIEDAREKGMDMLLLGGQRQRYAYYGFQPGGQRVTFCVTEKNLRVSFPDMPRDIAFEEISRADDPRLDAAWALYEKGLVHGARPREGFLRIAHTWTHKLYAVLRGGRMIGYTADGCETLLEDDALLPAVLYAWLSFKGLQKMDFVCAPFEQERLHLLHSFAEDASLSRDDLLKVLHPARVAEALLRLRLTYAPCLPGRAVVSVKGWPTLAIEVRDGAAFVCETEETAQYTFSYEDGMAAFFSPLSPFTVLPMPLRDWLPLPLRLSHPDTF